MKSKPIHLLTFLLALAGAAGAQQKSATIDKLTREKLHLMLRAEYYELQQHYYDPRFHGVDLAALYRTLDAKLDAVQTLNEGYVLLEALAESLHDSHTSLTVAPRVYQSFKGFTYMMVGDKCFITHVRPKTDAVGKVYPGDQILAFNGYKVERDSFDDMERFFGVATMPSDALILRSPDGRVRHETVKNVIVSRPVNRDYTGHNAGMNFWHDRRAEEDADKWSKPKVIHLGDVVVWKQLDFERTDTEMANVMAWQVMGHTALVLDLRGNPGGDTETLKLMVGELIDHDVVVATREARKPQKPILAKTQKGHVYPGKVIVLVDSESASASELLAREIQLEHRGKVIGDRTAGAVMEAQDFEENIGSDIVTPIGLEITVANLVMSDGKSLEHVGVEPDEKLLPTAADLGAGRDPVLAQAIQEAGGSITPEDAGKLFPIKWRPIDPE